MLAWNNGGYSLYTPPIWGVFSKAAVPPVTPPASSDIPFRITRFDMKPAGPWTAVKGIVAYADRYYDFGPGTYFWHSKIKRPISLDIGRVTIGIDACGYSEKDTLTVSIGTMNRSTLLFPGAHFKTDTRLHEATFEISVKGTFELAIGATNMMAKSLTGSAGAVELPPGIPALPTLRQVP